MVSSNSSVNTNLPINNVKTYPGQTIIQTQVTLTGKCYINIKSNIISYVQQNSLRRLFTKKYRSLQLNTIGYEEGLQVQTQIELIVNEYMKPGTEG